jgi:FkbH-like protein
LNIGLQHMVFLDDNAAERAWVRERHPAVLVPEMPPDKCGYADMLCHCDLDTLAVTPEDRMRATMYWQEKQRQVLKAEVASFEEFLERLNLEVEIELLRSQLLERAEQLCQRTNQFNLTTRRHTSDQLRHFSESPGSAVFLMKVRDRFGDYGWSGLAIVEAHQETVCIESFLMSCRVMGKNAEYALMSAVARWGLQQGCTSMRGTFIPSSKNKPCKDFLPQCGFVPCAASVTDPGQAVEASIVNYQLSRIAHIKISVNLTATEATE